MKVFYPMEDQYTSFEAYLSEEHREHLHKNGLSDAVIDGRPYYSIDDNVREYLVEDWGFPEYKVEPEGLAIPRYHLGVEEVAPQIRYDVPQVDEDGEERRYDSVAGCGGVLDVHPAAAAYLTEIEIPLWAPESIKGADALLSRGRLAVGFQGVWGWSSNGRLAPGWRKIPLTGREVFIAFDSDVHRRRDLQVAIRRYTSYLKYEREAVVYIAKVPQPGEQKVGVDDHLGDFSKFSDAADAGCLKSSPLRASLGVRRRWPTASME